MKKEDGRIRITRQMIRTALLNLLREKPLQHITVRELCEKASINRGTFYAHYDDIYDLMEQIEQSMFDEFKAILRPLLEDQDPYDLVETITRIFCIMPMVSCSSRGAGNTTVLQVSMLAAVRLISRSRVGSSATKTGVRP